MPPKSTTVGLGARSEPLEVRVALIKHPGGGMSRKVAARKLVAQALDADLVGQLPVRCVLLLATADWCAEPSSLPREVRHELEHKLGYEVPLIGGSMASLFCLAEHNHFIEHGIIMVAFYSYSLWVTVTSLPRPHEATEKVRRKRLKSLASRLEKAAGIRIGSSAVRQLFGIFPGVFQNKRGELVYQDNEFHEEVLSAFQYRYRLIGGAAANALAPTVGYQFANEQCLKSGLALAIIETDLATGTMMGHGFDSDRETWVSVDALKGDVECGYDLALLDGKPAKERVAELQPKPSAGARRLFLEPQQVQTTTLFARWMCNQILEAVFA